ncbi:hypothetical protein BT69DRAFT_1216259 [Atractiella rhizophila]|nr:hypothetical protein BT69DRAFT_1216259 [Atractiella rhizophila]
MDTPDDENGKPRCPVAHHINPSDVKHDLDARIDYMTKFLGFDERDIAHIKHVAPLIKELIPGLVDHLYAKLFEFDITKKVFLLRGSGFDGNIPKRLEDLTLDSEQIKFRKVFMKVWATRILTSDYTDGKTWAYMDKVGLMHTGIHVFKKHKVLGNDPLFVPYRDIALTLGWVSNVLNTSVLSLSDQLLTMEEKIVTVQALNKVIWLQNDLFSRYTRSRALCPFTNWPLLGITLKIRIPQICRRTDG